MELRLYFRMLLRGWWIVVLTTLAALNVALLLSLGATPLYLASARFLVSPNPALTGSKDEISSLQALDKRTTVSTYAEVLNSGRMFDEAITALQIEPIAAAEYTVSAVVLPETSVLEMAVVGPDPQLTALIANNLGQRAIDYISGLYQVYDINFLEPAAAPSEPVSPQPVRDVSLATVLGLALGGVLAILREQIRAPIVAMRDRLALDAASNALVARSFRTVLDDELNRSIDETIALGMIRLNGLQGLIDTMPQTMVRSLLREATRILNRELRGADAVGRWDEITFAVMLPNTPSDAAVSTFGRILIALSRPFKVGDEGELLRLEPSIGVAVREYDEPAHVLVKHTESALLQADQETRNLILYRVDPFVTDSLQPRHVRIHPSRPATIVSGPAEQLPAGGAASRAGADGGPSQAVRSSFRQLTRRPDHVLANGVPHSPPSHNGFSRS